MSYEKPEMKVTSLEVKSQQSDSAGQDGPSKCSNSCCYYRDGATW